MISGLSKTELIVRHLDTASQVIKSAASEANKISQAAEMASEVLQSGGTVFWCGNGGSAADSQHLAAELIGRYKIDRKSLASIALTTDSSALTAIGNDFGFDLVFSRQLEGIGKAGDLLIALSTSGRSKNILNALGAARKINIRSVLLTSSQYDGNDADCIIKVASRQTEMIQHAHTAIGHVICEIVEAELYNH